MLNAKLLQTIRDGPNVSANETEDEPEDEPENETERES
jgi:hypothetical protein